MNTPIICDYGSAFSKVGFAGTDQPRSIFPTILGKFRYDYPKVGLDKEDCFIGREAQDKRSQLSLQSPISRGVIVNWDDMEKLWHYAFYTQLHVAPEKHPLMLTESPTISMEDKEKVSQILFETFNVPALNLSNQGVLSLFASGYTSGTIIESGEGMTYFVPIIEGCPLHLSTLKTDVAGQDLTLYLLKLLSKGRNVLVGTVDQECIRQMKEKCCYVALNFEKEKGNLDPCTKKFQLPDGEEITLGQERFFCPEALFQADLIEKNSLGIHMWAYKAISSCCPSLWKVLFSHILLSGGTGSCNGLQQRLQREMSELVSPTLVVKVSTCPFSRYGAWIGGSILASLSSFENMWITDKEYKENGLSIIRRRSY